MIPHFWRCIDLEDDHRVDRLVSTPEAVIALARNAPFVHSLKAGFIFMSYYYEGVMRFLDEQEDEEMKDSTTAATTTHSTTGNNITRIQRPPWLPQPDVRARRAGALPPMTQLSRLDVCFDRQYRGVNFDNAMLKIKGVRLICPLAWLLTLNATGMTHVTLRLMDCPGVLEIRCLARSLSKLTKLTHLRIDMLPLVTEASCATWMTVPMVPVLFYALPQSVVVVEMELQTKQLFVDENYECRLRAVYDEASTSMDEHEKRALDWNEGDLVAQKEPLRNLKTLILPSTYTGYSAEYIGGMMTLCPALESWDIPVLKDHEAIDVLCVTIRESIRQQESVAQKSKFLHHLTAKRPKGSCSGEDWAMIMNALPEQQVESVEFYHYMDLYPENFAAALLRHSETLRSLKIKKVQKFESRTLTAILTQCRGLETFWVTMIEGNSGQDSVALVLGHAVKEEWVCTRIKDLRITINMAPQRYSGVSGGSADQQQRDHYAKLAAFYTQLGRLTELEELEIFVSPPPMGSSTTPYGYTNSKSYFFRSLTGLLSLEEEDSVTGRRGFLSLLGGLKKLRVVLGSFRAGTVETINTFGHRETEWMVENWPALERIELFPEGYESKEMFKMPKHVEWLSERKPGLKLCR
ncbi:hypothetical protein EC991_001846 [Linnemannia zychae]|nr:hypothetical protein EC991_001846 [Linnemannia zychae]